MVNILINWLRSFPELAEPLLVRIVRVEASRPMKCYSGSPGYFSPKVYRLSIDPWGTQWLSFSLVTFSKVCLGGCHHCYNIYYRVRSRITWYWATVKWVPKKHEGGGWKPNSGLVSLSCLVVFGSKQLQLLYCEFAVIMSICCFSDMNKTLKTARSYFISQIGFEPAIN